MPSLFSRNKKQGTSVSGPFAAFDRTGAAPPPQYPNQPSQYPANPLPQHQVYTSDHRPLHSTNPDHYGHQQYSHPQRSADGPFDPPASSPSTAHESPNIDQRDPEPKRSLRERLGLTGANSRENLSDTQEEQSASSRLRRKASSARRPRDPYNTSPQSPPSSGSGRVTPQLGVRRPLNVPEEPVTETENLRDLANFFKTTAPSSDPRRRPISVVGDPTAWNKNKVTGDPLDEDLPINSRPRSGSLGDSLERGPPTPKPISQPIHGGQQSGSHANPIASNHPQYQAYHPQAGTTSRQQPTLPPLQTQPSPENRDLYPQPLSPSRQQLANQQPLSQHPFHTDSPPHFEVQGPDQQHHDSLEHAIAAEVSGHLQQQRTQQPVVSPAPRSALVSPTQEKGSGMPSANASLQLPPRRGSAQEGGSEPPTPNAVLQGKMQQPVGQGVQRAQTTTGDSTGRSTPPPQPITAKDMTEDEVNVLLQQFRETREKYSKVKRYYFEKEAQVTTLQNALAHQKLSQSRTSLDDGEYMQRLQRLDGLISQLSFGFRKDWKTIPTWLQPFVNKDCILVGKQEMTAVGRAFISRWLVDEIFNKYFHPGLDLEVSKELKTIQNNIRGFGTAMQTGEEEDALTSKIINWRLATADGLSQQLNSAEATSRRQHLVELLDAQLVSSLTEYMHEMPAGLEGGVHMITELAVAVLLHLPFESRDVAIDYYPPGSLFDERFMKAETTPIAPLGTPMADPADIDRASVNSDYPEEGDQEDEPIREKPDSRRGFLKDLVSSNKKPSPGKQGGAAAASQNSLLQPPGSSSGPKEDRVRLCVFLGLQIRGKMVLSHAPVFKTM